MVRPGQNDRSPQPEVMPALYAACDARLTAMVAEGALAEVAGLLAALMSSLASLFNSAATLFTVDIYEKLRPGRAERELVRVGRIATGVVVGFGLLWIPIMKIVSERSAGLYDYLQNVQGFLAPPITAVFMIALSNRLPRKTMKPASCTSAVSKVLDSTGNASP